MPFDNGNNYMLAVHSGSLEMVKWLREEDIIEADVLITFWTSIYGHVHILEWIFAEGLDIHDNCVKIAAWHGNLQTFKMLASRYEITPEVIASAIDGKGTAEVKIQILEWTWERGTKFTSHHLVRSLREKKKVFKWLYFRADRPENLYKLAKNMGRKKIARWIKARYCSQ
jgi:hypothetical protein